jgi:hypothetical protein
VTGKDPPESKVLARYVGSLMKLITVPPTPTHSVHLRLIVSRGADL